MPSNLAAALELASRGFRVLPLHDPGPMGKRPRLANWPTLATTDPGPIVEWWTKWPDSNIGGAMGGPERVIAIDIDAPKGGWDSLHDLPPLTTLQSNTGAGAHLFFYAPAHQDIARIQNRVAFRPGIDVRAAGGFVVLPPSVHESGNTYAWANDSPIAPLPDWLYDIIASDPAPVRAAGPHTPRTDPPLMARIDAARAAVLVLPPAISGQDGHSALLVATTVAYRGFDLPRAAAELVLEEYNRELCQPLWSHSEIAHKLSEVESTERAGEHWGYLLDIDDISAALAPDPPPPPVRGRSLADFLPDPKSVILRQATGIPTLDEATRGGFRMGSLVVVGGAPGACKTALVTQWALDMARTGTPVFILAADEGPDGLTVRLGQQLGLDRDELEAGRVRETLRDLVKDIPLDIFDGALDANTVDALAALLPVPGVLVADSLQTVRPGGASTRTDPRLRVDETVKALKRAAARGHLVITTSELSRGAYRSEDAKDQMNPLAAFKESGAIEYAATVAIVLTSPKGESCCADACVPKNRLGSGKPEFRLRLDPARARLTPEDRPDFPDHKRVEAVDDSTSIRSIEDRIVHLAKTEGIKSVERLGFFLRDEGLRFSDKALRKTFDMLVKEHALMYDVVSFRWVWLDHQPENPAPPRPSRLP